MAAVVAAAMGLNVHHWKTNLSYNVFQKVWIVCCRKNQKEKHIPNKARNSASVLAGRASWSILLVKEGGLNCTAFTLSSWKLWVAVVPMSSWQSPSSSKAINLLASAKWKGSFVSGSGCSVHLEFQLSTLLCRRASFSFRLIFEKFTCRPHWDVVQDQVVQVLQNLFHRWVISRVSQSNELLRDHAGEGRVVQQRSDSFGWYHTAGCKALTQLATHLVDLHVLGHPASCPLKFHQCENAQADLLDTFFERTDTNEPHSFYQDMHSWPKSFILPTLSNPVLSGSCTGGHRLGLW